VELNFEKSHISFFQQL